LVITTLLAFGKVSTNLNDMDSKPVVSGAEIDKDIVLKQATVLYEVAKGIISIACRDIQKIYWANAATINWIKKCACSYPE
jgi:hypothetical protein